MGKPGILFVDDEEKARKYFQRVCRSDFTVYMACDIDDAANILAMHSNDIAILVADKRMPHGSGLELIADVKVKAPRIIRILTTAFHESEDVIRAINEGEIYRYIPKPWDLDKLRSALFAALKHYEIRQAEARDKKRCLTNSALLLAHITHEFESPLYNLTTAIEVFRAKLPSILAIMDEVAVLGEWSVLSRRDVNELRLLPDNMELWIQQIHVFMDTLIANVTVDDVASIDKAVHSAAACLNEVLQVYPLSTEYAKRVHLLTDEDFMFYGSDELLILVMFNLLRNALHSIEQARRGDVVIRLRRGENVNFISIRDTGMGIEEKVLPRIFDDYFTTKEPSQGLGMGLAFCKKVLLGMNASIDCESVEGRYTEFRVSMPKLADEDYRRVRVESDQLH